MLPKVLSTLLDQFKCKIFTHRWFDCYNSSKRVLTVGMPLLSELFLYNFRQNMDAHSRCTGQALHTLQCQGMFRLHIMSPCELSHCKMQREILFFNHDGSILPSWKLYKRKKKKTQYPSFCGSQLHGGLLSICQPELFCQGVSWLILSDTVHQRNCVCISACYFFDGAKSETLCPKLPNNHI